jgi:hypothetical protein
MRHIKIYEAFQDEVPASMRDLFGLTSSMKIQDGKGGWFTWSGPSELYEKASEIAVRISARLADEIDKLIKGDLGYQKNMDIAIKELEPEFAAMAQIGYIMQKHTKTDVSGVRDLTKYNRRFVV